jgi:hypothetical protein
MDSLISLLIVILIFGCVAYAMYWVCVKFQAPPPVFWICGIILLIFLLYFLMGQFGGIGGGHSFSFRR